MIINVLRPKSEEEIEKSLSSLSQKEKNEKLFNASARGHKDRVKMLLKAGADVNAKNNNGSTALIGASYNDHKDIVELLLNAGADVNAKNEYGDTALMWASREALMWASVRGHKDIIQMLLDNGANYDI